MNDNTLINEINSLNFERGELIKLKSDQNLYAFVSNKLRSSVKAKQLLFKVFCWSKSRETGNDYRLFVIKHGGLKAASEIEISDKVFEIDPKNKSKVPPISRGSTYLETVRNLYKSSEFIQQEANSIRVTNSTKLSKKAHQIKTADSAADVKQEQDIESVYDSVKEWIWGNFISFLDSESSSDVPLDANGSNDLPLAEDIENLQSAYSSDMDDSASCGKPTTKCSEVDDNSSGNLPPESRSATPTSRGSSSPVSMDENSNTSLSASCKLKLLNFEKIRTRNQGRISDPHTSDIVPLADHADDSELQPMSNCGKVFCNMGCVCDSISTSYSREETCGLIECVFHCSCTPVYLPSSGSTSTDSGFVAFVAKRPKRNVRPPSKIRDFAVVTNFQTESASKFDDGVLPKKKRMYLLDPKKLKASSETPEGSVIRFQSSKKLKAPSKKPPLFTSRKSSIKKTTSSKTDQSKFEQSAIEDGKKLKVVLTKLDVETEDDSPQNKKKKSGKVQSQVINSQLQTWLLRRQQSDVSSLTLSKRRQAQKLLAQAAPFVSPIKKPLNADKKLPLKRSKAKKVSDNGNTLKLKTPKSKVSVQVLVKESMTKSVEQEENESKTEKVKKFPFTIKQSEDLKLTKTSGGNIKLKSKENKTSAKLKNHLKSKKLTQKAAPVVMTKRSSGVSKKLTSNKKVSKRDPKNQKIENDHIDLILDASEDEHEKDNVPLVYNKELFQFSSNSLISSDSLGIKLTVSTVPEFDNNPKPPQSNSNLKQTSTSKAPVFGKELLKNENSDKLARLSSDLATEHWQLVQENLQIEIGNQRSTHQNLSPRQNLSEIENTSVNEEQLSDSFEKKYPFMARAPPKSLEDLMKCARVNSTNFLLTCARCRPVSERFFMKNAIRAEQNDILVKWRENLAENSSTVSKVSNDLTSESNLTENKVAEGNKVSTKNEALNSDATVYTPEDFAEFKSTYVYLNGNRVEIFSNCNWSSKKLKIYERVLKNMENPYTFKFRIGVFCVEIIDNLNKNLSQEKLRHDFDNIRKIVVIKYKLTVDNETDASKGGPKTSIDNSPTTEIKGSQNLGDEKNNDKVQNVLLPEELLNYDAVTENAANESLNNNSKASIQQISKDGQPKPKKLIILSKKEDYAQFAQQKAIMSLQAASEDLAKSSENPEVKGQNEKTLDKDIACDESFDHSLYTYSGTNSKKLATEMKVQKMLHVESHPKIVKKEVAKLSSTSDQSEKQTTKQHAVMKVSVNSLLSEKDKQYAGKVVKSSEIARAISQRWHSQRFERNQTAQVFERNKVLRAKLHANSLQTIKPSLVVAGQRTSANNLSLNPPPDQQKPIVIYRNISDRKRSHDSGAPNPKDDVANLINGKHRKISGVTES